MLKTKLTLGAMSLATAVALVVAVTKKPQVPVNEMTEGEKIEYFANQAEKENARTYNWDNRESVATNVIEGAKTTGNIIAQGAEKSTDYPALITAALALEFLGLGAVAKNDKKKAKQKQEEQRIAFDKQQADQAEETRKQEEIRQARNAEKIEREKQEVEQARLSELDKKMADFRKNMENFDFQAALSKFGVTDTKHPIKKLNGQGYTRTSSAQWGQIHTEYYMSNDGRIVEAGIKQLNRSDIDKKDYNYAYVRVVNPTVEGKVCELGRLHYTDEYGKAHEYNLTATVDTYYEGSKPYRVIGRHESDKIVSRNVVVDIPKCEQLERGDLARKVGSYLTTGYYSYNYDNNEHGEEEKNVRDKLFSNNYQTTKHETIEQSAVRSETKERAATKHETVERAATKHEFVERAATKLETKEYKL